MKKLTLLLFIIIGFNSNAQLPNPALVGYWENWFGNFVYFSEIDPRYNVIMVSFASYKTNNDYEMKFVPEPGKYWMDNTLFKTEMEEVQAKGKKVLISLGGATYPIMLDSDVEKAGFVSSVGEVIDEWGFDGIDIDLEGSSLNFNEVKIGSLNDGDERLRFMVEAIQEIMANYYIKNGKKLLLTMAPETHYVQKGMLENVVLNDHGGAYLPMIEALKDSIDMLNVQLYNSGEIPGLDGKNYTQSTADFILALTESVIHGFTAAGDMGEFTGLPASKIGVGLPSCSGWGYTKPEVLDATMRYLMGEGNQPGNYTLIKEGGYPDIRGMMTWSLNTDHTCEEDPLSFVNLYDLLFNDISYLNISNPDSILITNEDGGEILVEVEKNSFNDSVDINHWKISNLPTNVELDSVYLLNDTVAKAILKGSSSPGDAQYHVYNTTVTIAPEAFKQTTDTLSKNWGVTLTSESYYIPARIQGEDYHYMIGSGLRPIDGEDQGDNSKLGGGTTGAYSDYYIFVPETKAYGVDFRYSTGMKNVADYSILVDNVEVHRDTLAGSGGWDTFKTISFDIPLTEGKHTIRIYINKGWYGLNWFEFKTQSYSTEKVFANSLTIFPNPVTNNIFINNTSGKVSVLDVNGKLIKSIFSLPNTPIDLSNISRGVYQIILEDEKGTLYHGKFVKK